MSAKPSGPVASRLQGAWRYVGTTYDGKAREDRGDHPPGIIIYDASGHMAVLKTGPANAHPVAFAFDNASFPEIIGTIAGDDTLALIAREPHTGHDLIRLIERLQEETP